MRRLKSILDKSDVWVGIPTAAPRWILLFLLLRFAALYLVGIFIEILGLRAQPHVDHPWAESPYHGYTRLSINSRNSNKDFDAFISYKSDEVEPARLVADMLIASGIRIWFAEYTIMAVDRNVFEDFMMDGVKRSKFGIVWSSNAYARSDHCMTELEQLLAPENCSPERVMDIRRGDEHDTHDHYPLLLKSPTIKYEGTINPVLHFIERTTSWQIEPLKTSTAAVRSILTPLDTSIGYSLDVTGWKILRRGGEPTVNGVNGPACTRIERGRETRWNLIVGPMFPGSRPSPMRTEDLDERQFFQLMINSAAYFTAKHNARLTGVHLLYLKHLHEFSQVAFTYWFRRDSYWTRRYSIVTNHPRTGQSLEFAFTFHFFGPFQDYCSQTNDMDRVVQSIRWEGR